MSKGKSGHFYGTSGNTGEINSKTVFYKGNVSSAVSVRGKNDIILELRLMLVYHCYPVWVCDKEGNVVGNSLPDELRDNDELDCRFKNLQSRYDALFLENTQGYSYLGFQSREEKQRFLRDWSKAVEELCKKAGGRYEIIDDICKSF